MSIQPTVSDEIWQSHACLYNRSLDAAAVAAFLDESENGIVSGFFSMHHDRFGKRWSFADIFDYIIGQHQDRADARIPRLFPVARQSRPARLLFTQRVEIPDKGIEVVAHAWDPHDSRGLIAIAYPVRDCHQAMGEGAAAALLGALTWASAVAVPSGHDVEAASDSVVQPGIWLADARVARERHGVGVVTGHYGWGDLANLLRVELPWWSGSLRDRDAMLSWRPGDSRIEISPATVARDPGALQGLATLASSIVLRRIISKAARRIEYNLVGGYADNFGTDHYQEFVGLKHAAEAPRSSWGSPPPLLTAGESALLLHQRVDDRQVAQRAASSLGRLPVAHTVYTVDAVLAQHPLAQAWLSRLTPASRPNELGFELVAKDLSPNEESERLVHPLLPDCWIVRCGDATHITIGTAVPASGYIASAYVDACAAFFRDSTGTVWPLPMPFSSVTGSPDLVRTLGQLRVDAAADLDLDSDYVEPGPQLRADIANASLPVSFDFG